MKKDLNEMASNWVVKEHEGLTDTQQKEFIEWLETTPGASDAMNEMRNHWQDFGSMTDVDFANDLLQTEEKRWIKWSYGVAAAVVAILGLTIWQYTQETTPAEPITFERQIVDWNQSDFIQLDDGSIMELNQGALVEYKYSGELREIWVLEGEAYFSVEEDSLRPFRVYAGNSVTEAVGTEFNVRYMDQSVEVYVAEGEVKFSVDAENSSHSEEEVQETYLPENYLLVLNTQNEENEEILISRVQQNEGNKIIDWKPLTFRFEATPVSEIVEKFNSINEIQMIILDDRLKDIKLSVKFRSNKPKDFAKMLEITSGVIAEYENEVIYLSMR